MAASTTPVTVFGPNLTSVAQRRGDMHVHATSCADCGHYGPGRKFGGEDGGWDLKVADAKELVWAVYGDMISENPDGDWTDYLSDLYFAPCVKLPHDASTAATEAATPAAPAATTKEGTMATTAKKDSTKKASTPKAKKPQLTLAQVEAEMADTKDAFDAYYVAYYAEPRDEAGMAANKAGKSTYWRHYNDPRVKAKRDKARDAKKAKAEKAAAKKAPAKAKEAPVAEAPAEVTEGQDPSEA